MKRVCIELGCPSLTTGTRCPEHKRSRQRGRDAIRGTAAQRGYGHAWQKVRAAVLERDGGVCHWCGRLATTVDHVVPKVRGGSDEQDNLVAACLSCNSRRGQAARR